MPVARSIPAARAVVTGLLAAFVLTFALAAFVPAPTFACSCAQISIGELDPTQNQVFVATAGEPMPQGTPVAVELWLTGPGAAPVVMLSPQSFENTSMCGVPQFQPGSRWILSTWAGDPTTQPSVSICQPHAQLDTPEGQTMLAEAQAAYGPGAVPEGGGAPTPAPTPEPSAPEAPADPTPLLVMAGIVGVAILGLGVVYLLGRGRPTAD